MKKSILLFALALATIGISSAGPMCSTADSTAAVSLYDGGCVIDDKLFSFLSFTMDSGAEAPATAQVKTIVLTDLLTPGLQTGSASQESESLLPYFAKVFNSNIRIPEAFLKFAGGQASVLDTVCATEAASCQALFAAFQTPSSDSTGITNNLDSDVAKDILVSTTGSDSTTVNLIRDRFLQADVLTHAPEPGSIVLFSVALLGGSLIRRKMQA